MTHPSVDLSVGDIQSQIVAIIINQYSFNKSMAERKLGYR